MPVACYLKHDVFHQPYLQIINILKLVKTCTRQKSYGVILQQSKKKKNKTKKNKEFTVMINWFSCVMAEVVNLKVNNVTEWVLSS